MKTRTFRQEVIERVEYETRHIDRQKKELAEVLEKHGASYFMASYGEQAVAVEVKEEIVNKVREALSDMDFTCFRVEDIVKKYRKEVEDLTATAFNSTSAFSNVVKMARGKAIVEVLRYGFLDFANKEG